MRSLLQVIRGSSLAGEDLPEILPALTASTIRFRRGQLHVVAGQPGRGKTLFAFWYAVKCGEPVLYLNADSDQGTMANRAGAMLLQMPVNEVKRLRDTEAEVLLEDAIYDLTRRVRIEPDPHPTLDGIYEEVQAYVEVFGMPPAAIFVDNLMNIQATHDNEWTGLRDAMSALHSLARETESAVIALHHTSEQSSNPDAPGPMRSVMGKVNQLPEVILSVARDGDKFHVAAVKNRDGEADPNATNPTTVYCDAPTMSLFNSLQELELYRTKREWQ